MYELGYTPKNLKRLLFIKKVPLKTAYEYIGKGRNTFGRYLKPVEHKNHVSMQHRDWLKIVDLASEGNLKEKLCNDSCDDYCKSICADLRDKVNDISCE